MTGNSTLVQNWLRSECIMKQGTLPFWSMKGRVCVCVCEQALGMVEAEADPCHGRGLMTTC